ncbi:MAG: Rrf2 family transcriptional regulator [Candidatus Omnitrophica bacterium]|nr:Rrf2 family transcriptional regulator [Candidatus Omnitrophota bacterium]
MRFTTKTEYGLICLIYMAKKEGLGPVTVREIVKDEHYSVTYMEKILQKLRAAKIVEAVHGNQGGYVLARHPSEIHLKSIVEALEGRTFEVFCEPKLRKEIVCNHFTLCGVKSIWHKTKEILDNYYESVTLEAMANNAGDVHHV